MTAVLRQMTVDDLPAVMKIERETFPADAWSEGMLRGELERPAQDAALRGGPGGR